MSGVRDKALRALLTDPVSGAPISWQDRVALAIGLAQAIVTILWVLVLSLGLSA